MYAESEEETAEPKTKLSMTEIGGPDIKSELFPQIGLFCLVYLISGKWKQIKNFHRQSLTGLEPQSNKGVF
jgi:hypothetical protein